MARISELSVEEVEHFFSKARDEVYEARSGVNGESHHEGDVLDILARLEARLVAQMGYPQNGE